MAQLYLMVQILAQILLMVQILVQIHLIGSNIGSNPTDVTSSNNNANDAPRGFSCWFDAFSSRFKLRVRWRKQQCQQLLHLGFTAQELQPAHNRAHGRRPAMYSPALVHEERGDELVSVPERYPITCVAMHGERLAAGDQAGRVVLWDLRTGQHSRVLTVHKAQIAAVVLNSQFLVAAGGPNGARVILWDAKNFALLGYLKPSKQHQQKKKKKKENQKDVEQQEQQQLELEQLDQQMEQQEQLEREQLEQLDQQDDLQQQAQVQQQQAVNRCVKAMKLVDNMLAILFHNGDVELWDLGAQKQIAKMQLRSGANDMDMVLQQGDNYQWLLDMNKRYLAAMMEDQKIHIFDLRFPQVCIKLIDLRIPESERCKLKPRQATQSSSANSPISHALSNFHALVGAPAAPVAAPPPTQNLLHISCLQLMGDEHAGAAGVIGICETEVDMQDGSSSSALKFLDIRTGREWIKLRVPCHNGSNQQHHNPQDLCTYFDQDKIVRAFDSETLVLDRRTGVPLNRVAIPRAGIQISAQACDELRMATATHVGGIVYRSFARSNLYWSELEGGRKLTE